LKEAFNINPDVELEIFYYDEANEQIVVTSNDDIYVALNHNDINNEYKLTITFEINKKIEAEIDDTKIITNNDSYDDSKTHDENDNDKTKNDFKSENPENKRKSLEDTNIKEIDTEEHQKNLIEKNLIETKDTKIINFPEELEIYSEVTYPNVYDGRITDCNQITFKSEDLIISRVGEVWGTKFYTTDSDHLGAFLHMFPFVKLTNTPPDFDIIAIVQIQPDQSGYKGTLSNGIRSQDYKYYCTSFTFKTFATREIIKAPNPPPTHKSKKRKIK